jgi:hypothetical protein
VGGAVTAAAGGAATLAGSGAAFEHAPNTSAAIETRAVRSFMSAYTLNV